MYVNIHNLYLCLWGHSLVTAKLLKRQLLSLISEILWKLLFSCSLKILNYVFTVVHKGDTSSKCVLMH